MEDTQSSLGLIEFFIKFFQDGGLFMYVILMIWGAGLAIGIEKILHMKKFDVDAPSFMSELQRYVLSNDIQGAIRVCSGSTSALARVLKSGLKRSGQNLEQVQLALDATALEVVPKVQLRLAYLSLIANMSTLFGLLGTIQGLIHAFQAVAITESSQKGPLLAKGIAMAMNTTALGLSAGISIMIIHGILNIKADKIVSEIEEYSVKLLDIVSSKKSLTDN